MIEPGTLIQILPVTRRFWYPDPLAEPLLWRKRVVSYRYFVRGVECDRTGEPLTAPGTSP